MRLPQLIDGSAVGLDLNRVDVYPAELNGAQARALLVDVAAQPAPPGGDIPAATVLLLTVAMASASGLGVAPFFFVGTLSKEWAALANAVACGVMLACSFDLMHEGQPYGGGLVVLGICIGALPGSERLILLP